MLIFKPLSAFVYRYSKLFFSREENFVGYQRQVVLVHYTLILLFCLFANILGFTGPSAPFNITVNLFYFLLILFPFVLYVWKKISMITAGLIMIVTTQVCICAETIYCALHPTNYNLMLIVANTVLLSINSYFSMLVGKKFLPVAVSFSAILTYSITVYLTQDETLLNFLFVFVCVFVVLSLMGHRLVGDFNQLSDENSAFRREEKELLHMLRVNKAQIKVYIELAKKAHSVDRTEELFGLLSESAQRHFVSNVREYLLKLELGANHLETHFPELTQSELEICRLIIEGKKLRDICTILDKSETNISSQRAHIRKKLGMQPSDILVDVLKARIGTEL